MMFGVDYLGAAAYPKIALQSLKDGYAFGCFAREFGDAYPLVQKVSDSGKAPIIRVQLCWAGSSHKYTNQHLKAAIKEAKRYDKIRGFSHIELSPFCEHTIGNPDAWLNEVKSAAPSCTIVNNPWPGNGALSKIFKNEIHGGPAPKFGNYNFSYDGAAAVDADVETDKNIRYPNAEIFFFWTWQLNCHFNARDKTRNTKPTISLIESLHNLANAKGSTGLPQGYLWKSHAEQSDPTGDSRSNKCLLIAPSNEAKFELVRAGKILATATRYPEDYNDGRRRYYFKEWGYKISQNPIQLRGGSGTVYGMVNPGFRGAPYRG